MNPRLVSAAANLFLLFSSVPLLAQAPAAAPPAPPPPAPITYVSPEIHPDNTVTFRLRAPNAQKVEVAVEGAVTPMQQDADGIWTGVSAALTPEIYSYHFNVDGTPFLDPRNANIVDNLLFQSNDFLIPGSPGMPWEMQAIPHGILHHHFYSSQVVLGLPNNQSDYYVYTPPGYSEKSHTRYPVLYLLHGFSDSAAGWSQVGKANLILDSLIATGKAKPMIVVMTLGYGNLAVLKPGRTPEINLQNTDLYGKALVTEVIPQIEASYHVSRKREDRAIAGLSMGGHESLVVGLNHPDLFAWVGTFSAGLNAKTAAELPTTPPAKASLRLLWMACGVDDGLMKPNRDMIATLKAQGWPVTAVETPGHHQWPVWRDNLIHFAPLLFQK